MNAGRPKSVLTPKEEAIMQMLWKDGELSVRDIVARFPEPRPHRNSVATLLTILEQKGHVARVDSAPVLRFRPITPMEGVRNNRLGEFVRNFFKGSYLSVVSALVKEEKISVDELRELIDIIEKDKK